MPVVPQLHASFLVFVCHRSPSVGPLASTCLGRPRQDVRERRVRFGVGARPPFQRVILAPGSRPWIENVHDVLELRLELRYRSQENAFERRNFHSMSVDGPALPGRGRTVAVDPIYSKLGIELPPETRGEEAVA